jgi:hypothetical protein
MFQASQKAASRFTGDTRTAPADGVCQRLDLA